MQTPYIFIIEPSAFAVENIISDNYTNIIDNNTKLDIIEHKENNCSSIDDVNNK